MGTRSTNLNTRRFLEEAIAELRKRPPIVNRAYMIHHSHRILSSTGNHVQVAQELQSLGMMAFSLRDSDAGVYCMLAAWRLLGSDEDIGIVPLLEVRRPEWFQKERAPEATLPTLEDLLACPLPLVPRERWAVFGTETEKQRAREVAKRASRIITV